jgi:hypothetical protein
MAVDNCKIKLGNLGEPGCVNIADVAVLGFFDMLKDSTGANKSRANADLTTWALLEPILNAADPRDRLYPVGQFSNVDQVRDESVFWTSNAGKKVKLRDGFKNFTGYIVNAPRELEAKLKQDVSQSFGWHFLDDANQIVTKKGTTSTTCRPIQIDNDTLDAIYVEKTDAAPAMMMISFQWKPTENDADVKVLGGVDYDANTPYGLLDVDAVFTNPTINTVTATITTTCYGDLVPDLDISMFTFTTISPTPGTLLGTTMQELSPGVYEFTWGAPQSLGDVIRISASTDGLDFEEMSDGTNDIIIQ